MVKILMKILEHVLSRNKVNLGKKIFFSKYKRNLSRKRADLSNDMHGIRRVIIIRISIIKWYNYRNIFIHIHSGVGG